MFHLKSDNNNWYTVHDDLCTFMIMSRSVPLIMRNVSDKSCRENQNTQIIFNNLFFRKSAVYEIMWKNMVWPDRLQVTMKYDVCALHAV